MDAAPLDDLAAHAHDASVVVVGGGIGGLVAALSCAKIGIRVTVIEASDRLGGALHTASIGGVAVDLGAEGYANRHEVGALIDELGLRASATAARARSEAISGLPNGPVPLPHATLRGIPENPFEEGVRRLIGWRGAWRAYLDRLRPPLTIGQERSLGRLVRSRMGDLVLDRLVAPVSLGAFAIHPDDVEVEAVAPGLSAALTRTGSLGGGVAQVRAAASKDAGRGAAGLEGIEGGMSRLVDALHERLVALGARILLGARVDALSARRDGTWDVRLGTDEHELLGPADHVIVATGAADAHRLLHGAVPSLEPVPTVELEVVTLVVGDDARATAAAVEPRLTAVYAIGGTSAAASVTDSTARWAWVGREGADDARVLKVTFGGPGTTPATAGLDDDAATRLALDEASAMLGVALDPDALRGSHRARYRQPPPISAIGRREGGGAAREAVHAVPGLSAVGAWIAGTGIGQVVPDALAEAERVRRAVLWDGSEKTSGP